MAIKVIVGRGEWELLTFYFDSLQEARDFFNNLHRQLTGEQERHDLDEKGSNRRG